jgi:hypothetical protein
LLASRNYMIQTRPSHVCRVSRATDVFQGKAPVVQACSNNRLRARPKKIPDRDSTHEKLGKTLYKERRETNFAKPVVVVTHILHCRYVLPD